MKWGTFGIVHISTLVIAALVVIGLYFLLKRLSSKKQIWILGILSFSGISAILFNLLAWNSPWEYLPLHLCSLNAMVLPFVVFTRNKTWGNVLLLWSLGALCAVVLNHGQADFTLCSWTFLFYFIPHVLEFAIPILLIKLKLVEKDHRCIPSTLAITLGMFTLVHMANKLLNLYFAANQITSSTGDLLQVNYMYTISPDNPLLALFYNVISKEYWYLYMALPVILIYLLIVYAPQLIKAMKNKKR